jgi:transposase-like protein
MAMVRCTTCGGQFNLGRDAQHSASRWHKIARTARAYRQANVSYSEIARQLGLSRYYVAKKLHEEGL